MANYNFNKVNLALNCSAMKQTQKGVFLSCTLNGKRNNDGSYAAGMNVEVFAFYENIPEANYENARIVVTGTFSVDEWIDRSGSAHQQFKIFADSVRIAQDGERVDNTVTNWSLRTFQPKQTEKAMILPSSLSGKKKPDGTYPKSMNVSVFCTENTNIQPDDYTNAYISVDGNISVGEWVDREGNVHPQYTIFATRVARREFNNRQNQNS